MTVTVFHRATCFTMAAALLRVDHDVDRSTPREPNHSSRTDSVTELVIFRDFGKRLLAHQ